MLKAAEAGGGAWRQACVMRSCVLVRVSKQSKCLPHSLEHQLLGERKLIRGRVRDGAPAI